MSHINRKCPKCNSRQTKIKVYANNLAYMGIWIHCKKCGVNTQISSPLNNSNSLNHQSTNGENK